MTLNKSWIKQLLFWVGYILAGFLLVYFTESADVRYTIIWIFGSVALLWLANQGLSLLLNAKLNWLRFGRLRFFTQLVLGILLSMLIVNLTFQLLRLWFTTSSPSFEQIVVMNVYGALIFIPIYSIYFSLYFLGLWRKSELSVAHFQKESMRSQLEALKNHLDPHFLFNNLNILTSLIDVNPEASKAFLEKFGEVYRAMLRYKAEDLISLSEELALIDAYCFLLLTRFQDAIVINRQIPKGNDHYLLPPLSLQLLIENAIKHNQLSKKSPLQISISLQDEYLCVSNNKQIRSYDLANESSGTGLANIRQRYAYFSTAQVQIKETEQSFTVCLPLLNIEKA